MQPTDYLLMTLLHEVSQIILSFLHILAMFGSAYICEWLFSLMQAKRLIDDHLQSVLRLVNLYILKPSRIFGYCKILPKLMFIMNCLGSNEDNKKSICCKSNFQFNCNIFSVLFIFTLDLCTSSHTHKHLLSHTHFYEWMKSLATDNSSITAF